MHGLREYVEAAGLISYGASTPDQFRRAADYVDKILRGTKARDIPIEQPTKFELVINLKNLQDARPRNSVNAARPRRRGDRMTIGQWPLALGTNETDQVISAYRDEADSIKRRLLLVSG